jgi:host factor-I protein
MVSEGIQDTFLLTLKEHKTPVYIFLANGIKLTGYITAFDSFCIQLSNENISQTVYKHAISTVMIDHSKTVCQSAPPLESSQDPEGKKL